MSGGGWSRVHPKSSAQLPLDDVLDRGVRSTPDVGAFASVSAGALSVLVWHYHDDDVDFADALCHQPAGGLPFNRGIYHFSPLSNRQRPQ